MIKNFKKKIILSGLISIISIYTCGAASADTKALMDAKQKEIDAQVSIKERSHNMAEYARSLGETEDSYIIFISKKYWNEAHKTHITLLGEYYDLETQYKKELKAEEQARLNQEAEERKQREKGTYLGIFTISAYTPSASENGGYSVTATGVPLFGNEWSICAVDPNVIPLGSTIHIEGVGNVRACDTGGAIRGNRIDLLVGYGQASSWGIQQRAVYIK